MKMEDTIAVREEEAFNQDRLRGYLSDNLGLLPVDHLDFMVRQFGGGMANLTYELDFGDQQLVLRRPPLGPVAASAHDMQREFRVLSRLFRAYPLAPRAFLFCGDEGVIGAPFFIMERRRGVVVRRSLPAAVAGVPEAPARMSAALVDALADLHAVDYKAVGLAGLGRPVGFIRRQIDGWQGRWERAQVGNVPEMKAVAAWLRENQPTGAQASLVHNDFKLDNVMLDAQDPGRVTAVFDWDMCTLGDPLSDVGALLAYWRDEDDPPYRRKLAASFMPADAVGFFSRRQILERYAMRSGRDLAGIGFYHALGLFRLTVILAQIYIRYKRGQTSDPRFAPLAEMIPLLAKAALDVCNSGGESV